MNFDLGRSYDPDDHIKKLLRKKTLEVSQKQEESVTRNSKKVRLLLQIKMLQTATFEKNKY